MKFISPSPFKKEPVDARGASAGPNESTSMFSCLSDLVSVPRDLAYWT